MRLSLVPEGYLLGVETPYDLPKRLGGAIGWEKNVRAVAIDVRFSNIVLAMVTQGVKR